MGRLLRAGNGAGSGKVSNRLPNVCGKDVSAVLDFYHKTPSSLPRSLSTDLTLVNNETSALCLLWGRLDGDLLEDLLETADVWTEPFSGTFPCLFILSPNDAFGMSTRQPGCPEKQGEEGWVHLS